MIPATDIVIAVLEAVVKGIQADAQNKKELAKESRLRARVRLENVIEHDRAETGSHR